MTKTGSTKQKSSAYAEITLHENPGINYRKALSLQSERAHGRSSTKITGTEGQLRIVIKAGDITALRASMNAIMRDIQVLASIGTLGIGNGRRTKQQRTKRTNTLETDSGRHFRKM